MHEPDHEIGPEFDATVRAIARDILREHGPGPAARQRARRAYAYLDARQFDGLWAAALRVPPAAGGEPSGGRADGAG